MNVNEWMMRKYIDDLRSETVRPAWSVQETAPTCSNSVKLYEK